MRRIPHVVRVAIALAAVALVGTATSCTANAGQSGAGGPTTGEAAGGTASANGATPGQTPSGHGVLSARPSATYRTPPGATTSPSRMPVPPSVPSSFPSAANTGVPSGHSLKVHSGTLTVSRANSIVDGVEVHGDINVTANNVTIRNSRVVTAGNWGIIQRQGVQGLKVLDTEVHGDGTRQLQFAVINQGGMITIQRCDFSVLSDPISTSVGLISDNYIHDPKYFAGDHTDMIQSNDGPSGSGQLVIRHNTLINTQEQTAAVALFQDFGVQHDAVIDGNLLAGGGYAVYGGAGTKGTSYNIQVINNVFSRRVFPNCGSYGPVAYWDRNGSGNVWQNNVWEDTGAPVIP